MYLVIKNLEQDYKFKSTQLRLYQNWKDAYNYAEQYVKESSGNHWTAKGYYAVELTKRFALSQFWYRRLKNGNIEKIKIIYMKVY